MLINSLSRQLEAIFSTGKSNFLGGETVGIKMLLPRISGKRVSENVIFNTCWQIRFSMVFLFCFTGLVLGVFVLIGA